MGPLTRAARLKRADERHGQFDREELIAKEMVEAGGVEPPSEETYG